MKKLTCHCGAVEAEINLEGDLSKVIMQSTYLLSLFYVDDTFTLVVKYHSPEVNNSLL